MSRSAPTADDASPLAAAEAERLFRGLDDLPALILAVSGGPDSTAMLLLAARWRDACARPPKLIAVTVDHGLRPASRREAQGVGRLARTLGIAHRTVRWTGRKPKTGLQEAARLARYRLLVAAARQEGARHVLTAHTLDDQAETVLLRMARGSGVSGLAGMGPVAPVPIPGADGMLLLRPLLGVPKSRLIATLKAAKVAYASDPTNRDPRFTRPRLRTLMPALAREGLTAARFAALARRVQRSEAALVEVLDHAQAMLAPGPWPPGGPVTIARHAFADLPHEIGQRLLGRAIGWTGDEGPVELGKLEALFEALHAAMAGPRHATLQRPGGTFRRTLAGAMVTLAGDRIAIARAPRRRGPAAKRGKTA